MRTVLGLDLSLTSSGLALPDGSVTSIKTKTKGCTRLAEVRDRVIKYLVDSNADYVAMEGYAFGRPNQAHYIGELGGVVKTALHEAGCHFVVVPPSNVKMYATGKGNANKDEVLSAAVLAFGFAMSNDEADALWLRAMAHDAFGEPVVRVPEKNRAALTKIKWEEQHG